MVKLEARRLGGLVEQSYKLSGLGSRPSGIRCKLRVRAQVRDLNFTWDLHLYLNTRTRDRRAETWDLKMISATRHPELPPAT